MKTLLCVLCVVAYVSAHSMLLCFDNGGLTVDKLTLAAGKNPCNGYPRGRIKFDEQSDGFTNRPGDVCGTDFGTAYPAKYPASTIAAGSKFYPEWAARNHANTPNAGNVQFFLSPVNTNADPTQSVFEQNKICDISYSNCNQNLGANDAPCTGECTLPASTAPGTYVVQWWWEFNPGELYSNCADITVTSATGTATGTSAATGSATGSSVTNNSEEDKSTTERACTKDSDCDSGVCRINGFCMAKSGIGAGGVAAVIFAILFAAAIAVLVVGFLIYKKKKDPYAYAQYPQK